MQTWSGTDGDDFLAGADEDNVFFPGYGTNGIAGSGGRDVVLIAGFTSVFPANADAATLKLAAYPHSVNTVDTGAGDDTVILDHIGGIDPANPSAAQGRQFVSAGAGNDWVEVSAPTAATVFGGAGDDVLLKTDLRTSYTYLADGSQVSTFITHAPDNTRQDVAWSAADVFSGGAGNDLVRAGDGPDWVYGDEGNDWLELGAGTNVAWGGGGDDVILVSGFTANLVVGGLPPHSYNQYSISTNAIWAGEGNDVVSVSHVSGGDFGMAVNGEGGDDWIAIETTGSSVVTGGVGNDTLLTLAAPSEYIYGTHYPTPADVIYGGAGDDVIYSDRGNDLVYGGDGHDWIFGGLGSDMLFLGDGTGDDHASDRVSVEYLGLDPSALLTSPGWWVDTIAGFQPASRFGAPEAGVADKIDVGALLKGYERVGYYGAANPFDAGILRLAASGADTQVEILDPDIVGPVWRPFLTLVGVAPGELDTTVGADLSGGLAAASGGDFLWYTG